jgi:hypothetical protein
MNYSFRQKRKSVASNHVDGSTQIARYGVMRDSYRGNQAANHIGGSCAVACQVVGRIA